MTLISPGIVKIGVVESNPGNLRGNKFLAWRTHKVRLRGLRIPVREGQAPSKRFCRIEPRNLFPRPSLSNIIMLDLQFQPKFVKRGSSAALVLAVLMPAGLFAGAAALPQSGKARRAKPGKKPVRVSKWAVCIRYSICRISIRCT